MNNSFDKVQKYFNTVKMTLSKIDKREITRLVNLLYDTLAKSKNIFIFGNGGSASTASHWTNDFTKGVSYNKFKDKSKILCLNDNISTLTAYANDNGFENVFLEQLKKSLNYCDLVIGISCSGNSENILKAICYANNIGATTVGITGFDGGKLRTIAKYNLHVPVQNMQVAEDIHLLLGHLLMNILNHKLEYNFSKVSQWKG